MAKSTKRMPRFLKDIAERNEFWEYISRSERRKRPKKDLLPIQSDDNRSLYIRLAAFAMIGAAKKEDSELLHRLTRHSYSLIASTAARSIVSLQGERALRSLSAGVDDSIRRGQAESLADALRSAEMKLFHIVSSR